MISNNSYAYSFKIFIEILVEILYFPLWWYSRGLFWFLKYLFDFIRSKEKSLALFVWCKNILKPMYKQNDWQGFLISFVMRLFQIIFRSFLMLVFILLSLFALFLWIFIPLFIIYELIFQMTDLRFNWIADLF